MVMPAVILLAALVVLILGVRGRVVGDDPHCRKCGFNLRGRDPASTRCPECGTELTPDAITQGLRRRRPMMVTVGAAAVVVAGVSLGVSTWRWVQREDWSTWKPTTWLVEDLESGAARERERAKRELHRRLADGSLAQQEIDKFVDRTLALQADRSKPWNVELGRLVEAAARAKRVDRARWETYLRQSISAHVHAKPKARRGKEFALSVHGAVDRCADGGVTGTWQMESLNLGGTTVPVFRPREPSKFVGRFENNTSVLPFQWRDLNIPDGRHDVATKVIAELSIPGIDGSAKVELPVSAAVEVVPGDAIVDSFQADPSKRRQMVQAFELALVNCERVNEKQSELRLRLKSRELPEAFAFDAFVVQGNVEHMLPPSVLIEPEPRTRWTTANVWIDGELTGAVDVHLRPSQDAVDRIPQVRTYWGEPIVLRNINVNAPYAAPFNTDESLRPAVEKSLSAKVERLQSGALRVSWRADRPPVDLAYAVVIVGPQRRHVLESCWTADPPNQSSNTLVCDDVDPQHQAKQCDLIFAPADSWEMHAQHLSANPTPPWGGTVILRNLPIESPKAWP